MRARLTARIVSGSVRLRASIRGHEMIFVVVSPDRKQRYAAEEVYDEVLQEGELEGLWDAEGLLAHLRETGQWDEEREAFFVKLPKEIEQLKIALWQAMFKSEARKKIRRDLATAKAKLAEVTSLRHRDDYLTAAGNAAMARSRYLLACGLRHEEGQSVFDGQSFWDQPCELLDQIGLAYAKSRLDETTFRDLARNEPWRSIWSCRKADTLFGVPAADYTEEQTTLARYSSLYDSVYESPECPDDKVVVDDDLLDGWLLSQKEQRDRQRNKQAGESVLGNSKIRDSQEVFIPADSHADAVKIDNLNDAAAARTKQVRLAHLAKKGEASEAELPRLTP